MLEGFAQELCKSGYAEITARRHIRAAEHQQNWFHDDFLYDSGRGYIGESGISEKQTGTLPKVPPVRAAIPWASASIQVLTNSSIIRSSTPQTFCLSAQSEK